MEYAVPTSPAPTLAPNTRYRTNPAMRATTVMIRMIPALRSTARAVPPSGEGSVVGDCSVPLIPPAPGRPQCS